MKRIILTGAALAAILTGGVVAAAPAFASNGPQQFVTHAADHEDTSDLINPVLPGQQAVINDPTYGPVWAWDNLTVKLTPTPVTNQTDGANWQVRLDVTGSFTGFANPNTGAALQSNGPVTGTITYDVSAPDGVLPSGASLPAQEAGGLTGTHLGQMVTQLFGGNAKIVGGGSSYTFSYQNGAYVQDNVGTGVHGDVRGH